MADLPTTAAGSGENNQVFLRVIRRRNGLHAKTFTAIV
jgi:hypothetical protein